MSNNTYIGKETTVTIGGKKYTLSRLTRSVMREFAEWVHAHTPDPLAMAAQYINEFPEDLQKLLIQQAWNDTKGRMDVEGPEVRPAMNTIEGSTKLLQLLLQKHHPELTEDQVFDLALEHFDERVKERAKELRETKPELTEEEAHRIAMEEVEAVGSFRLDLSALPR
jgi:hypothetical protein